jgi:hypothetical protein
MRAVGAVERLMEVRRVLVDLVVAEQEAMLIMELQV